MSSRKKTTIGLLIAGLTLVGSFFVPEVRRFLRLENPKQPKSSTVFAQTSGSSTEKSTANGNTAKGNNNQAGNQQNAGTVSKNKVKGNKNATGNGNITGNVTGNGNIVGNNNTVTVQTPLTRDSVTAQPEIGGAKKQPESHEPQKTEEPKSPPQINAPNGIAIGGGIVNNPIVNNYSDRQPRPGVTPKVAFCLFPSKFIDGTYRTKITVNTDTPITDPFWAFVFDGPVIDGEAVVKRQGVQIPHALNHGHPSDPSLPDAETILRLQVSLGVFPFVVKQSWQPDEQITFTISSPKEVHLTKILSGYGTEFLDEQMRLDCGQN